PLWTAITESVMAPLDADFDDVYGAENAIPTRRQLAEVRKLLMIPEIRDATFRGLNEEWVAAIAERTGTDPERDMYPRLVAAVVRAVGDVVMDEYGNADPPVAFAGLLRKGFAAVAAGLPEPGRNS
ncbi:acyl-CoA-like ligand-binding transcription factor, partial [Mycolicibacterium mageritense]